MQFVTETLRQRGIRRKGEPFGARSFCKPISIGCAIGHHDPLLQWNVFAGVNQRKSTVQGIHELRTLFLAIRTHVKMRLQVRYSGADSLPIAARTARPLKTSCSKKSLHSLLI